MVIYHGCGDARAILKDFVELGLDGYNPLEAKAGLDVVELKKQFANRMAFCGNIDMRVLEKSLSQAKELARASRGSGEGSTKSKSEATA